MTAAKAAARVAAVAEQTAVEEIAVDRLALSPEEMRRTIDYAALRELAQSIAANGVIEALLVRSPLGGCFEIVAGQRRWLASKLAGKATCPCIVRELTDAEARELRIISNLQREDLPPMEEAEAYGKLLEAPGATVESVAAILAKSPSYVGRRLQLLKAIAPVREVLKAGAIEVGHGLELARLDEDGQRRMLHRMELGGLASAAPAREDDADDEDGQDDEDSDDEEADGEEEGESCASEHDVPGGIAWRKTTWSVADLRRRIAEVSHVDLKNAPFPLVADLAPMPCTDCPKRAGNAQLLFDDCAQDTCTDRTCFNRKVNAWIDAELAAAKAEKRKLLKLTESYAPKKDEVAVGTHRGVFLFKSPHECEHGEDGIWIDDHSAGQRATVCRKGDCKVHRNGSGSGSSSGGSRSAAPNPKGEALLARVRAEKAYRAALFTALAARPQASITHERLRQLAGRLALFAFRKSDSRRYGDLAAAMTLDKDFFGWGGAGKLAKHVAAMPIQDQLLFAAMAVEDSELCVHEHYVAGGGTMNKALKLGLEEIAEIVGVDWKALRKQHEDATEKPAAKPLKNKVAEKAMVEKVAQMAAAGTAKKPAKLSAAGRQRIADAAKKRWGELQKAAKKPAKKPAKKAGRR